MEKLILKNCNVNGDITDIIIEDGIIASIGKTENEGIDIEGKKVYPGLIDIHCHGMMGHDTMDAGDLTLMSEYLAERGITSWYPTTMTMSFDDIKNAVNNSVSKNGANVLGYHIEGPYISPKYKGAQNEIYIKAPDVEEFKELKKAKLVTVAPELSGSCEFIEKCGAKVSLGHSAAGYDDTVKAIDSGAVCLTHTFNAMSPFNHREPGLIGAALDKNIYVQVICDGLHIHPAVIRMLYNTFGKERMILISDSMSATGLEDGMYDLGGLDVVVKNGEARTLEGALAGSTKLVIDCVKKAISFGIPEADAFYMASKTPAQMMGLNKGEIKEGYDADLIVVDEDIDVKMTVIGGKIFSKN